MDEPDIERLVSCISLEEADRIPLAELGVDDDIKKAMLGKTSLTLEDHVDFHVKAGMDYIRVLADGRYFPVGSIEKSYRYSLYTGETVRAWASENIGPIRTFEDFERFPFPELSNIHASTAEKVKRIIRRKYPKMGMIAGFGDVFTRTWQLRGFKEFCRDLYTSDRRLIKRIYEKVAEISLQECKVLIEAGVDAVWPSDDIAHVDGPLIHPKFLREFFFPWLKQVGALARRHGLPVIYHSDGDLTSLMDDILSCHVDAIHPIEPKAMNLAELKEKWGDRLAFIGNIDLNVLSLGSLEDVVREVRDKICKAASGGGYAVGSSNTVAHYVKLENYIAMIEAAKKWGRYPIK